MLQERGNKHKALRKPDAKGGDEAEGASQELGVRDPGRGPERLLPRGADWRCVRLSSASLRLNQAKVVMPAVSVHSGRDS